VATHASDIRTIAVIGQGGVGKTSVADALLFAMGATNRLGRVDDETSLFDTEAEEVKRRSSITSAVHHGHWNKTDINVIDTPGHGDFVSDAHFALRAAAGVLLVVDPIAPLRAETVKVWRWARDLDLPAFIVVNRLDHHDTDTDIDATLAALAAKLEIKPLRVQLPITGGGTMTGVVDVLDGKAHLYDGSSGKFTNADVPSSLVEEAAAVRADAMEAAAESDDALLEKYLDEGELSDADLSTGLLAGVASSTVHPVFCVSAHANVGFAQLLNAVVSLMPAPTALGAAVGDNADGAIEIAPDPDAPFVGFVFKTQIDPHAGHLALMRILAGTLTNALHPVNARSQHKERLGHLLRVEGKKTVEVAEATVGDIVAVAKLKDTHAGDTLCDPERLVAITRFEPLVPAISFAVEAANLCDEDKAMQGLRKLTEEDLALHVERDEDTGEMLISGSGQLHVEVAVERLEHKYGVSVVLKAPKVPYRETMRKKVEAHGRVKKQSGGHGQFADCKISVEPLTRGAGFEFVDKIVGGSIPRQYIPAVEKGVIEAMQTGAVAHCPVVDVRVTLLDGQFHDVDSSEMAFKVAGSLAFKDAMEQSRPALLEPYVHIEVTVPEASMGDVMGDLNARRAKVEGMEADGADQIIKARVPMAEILRYAPDLTSMTHGAGHFQMSFSHYELAPDNVVAKVHQEAKADA
jgi:elongation factor G